MPSPLLKLFTSGSQPHGYRFGPFELEVRAGELRKRGVRIRLRKQAVQILVTLLEHSGQVVLREEIRQKLWPGNTVVEFRSQYQCRHSEAPGGVRGIRGGTLLY